jgi:alpha-N-acetylglucosamine transferase
MKRNIFLRFFLLFLVLFAILYFFYSQNYSYSDEYIDFEEPLSVKSLKDINEEAYSETINTNKTEKVPLSACKNVIYKEFEISIWTFLTDSTGYFNSSIKLLMSIKKFTKSPVYFDTIMLEIKEKPLSAEIKQALSQVGWKFCQVDKIPPRNERKTFGRFRDQFTKLILWSITEYKAIFYLDSDILVVGNIDAFLKMYKYVGKRYRLGVTRDIFAGKWKSTFNMGVFVMKPNRTEFDRLIDLKKDSRFKFDEAQSEQGFLNVVYKDEWFDIGFEHNANLAVYSQKNSYWRERENDINMIHFTMEKPWACSNTYEEICDLWKNFDAK